MGGTLDDIGRSIAVDTSGNVYTVGQFSGTVDFDPGPGVFNLTSAGGFGIFVSKLDSSGNFVWAKAMGGTSNDYGFSISVDSSGNVYTTGFFYGTADFDPGPGVFNLTSAGGSDIFVSKLDSNGNFVWARAMGGTYSEVGSGISVDNSGNVYTVGNFSGTADFDLGLGVFNLTSAGGFGIFISKLDSNGNFVWARAMGGHYSEYGRGIAVDTSGNVYTTGQFSGTADFDPGSGVFNLTSAGGPGISDIFVSKLNSNGNFVWAKAMGGTSNDYGTAISIDTSGNVYTTGNFSGTPDFDPGPGVFNLTSAGGHGIFVSKLDSNGNFVWAKAMGGTYSEVGNGIAVDTSGNVYTTGVFRGTVDFDPGPGVFNLTSAEGFGISDIFVSKLDGQYNLTTSVTGGHGSLSPPSGDYGEGTVVDLTATPDAGYKVAAWSGTDDDSLTTMGNHATLDSDKTVTVQFEMISAVGKFPWVMFLPTIIGIK